MVLKVQEVSNVLWSRVDDDIFSVGHSDEESQQPPAHVQDFTISKPHGLDGKKVI